MQEIMQFIGRHPVLSIAWIALLGAVLFTTFKMCIRDSHHSGDAGRSGGGAELCPRAAERRDLCHRLLPVSYTHLDVYKRQVDNQRPQGEHGDPADHRQHRQSAGSSLSLIHI